MLLLQMHNSDSINVELFCHNYKTCFHENRKWIPFKRAHTHTHAHTLTHTHDIELCLCKICYNGLLMSFLTWHSFLFNKVKIEW